MSTWLNVNGMVFFHKQHRVANEDLYNIINDYIRSLEIEDDFDFEVLQSEVTPQMGNFLSKTNSKIEIPTGIVFRIQERSPNLQSFKDVGYFTERFLQRLTREFGFLVDFNFHIFGSSDFGKPFIIYSSSDGNINTKEIT